MGLFRKKKQEDAQKETVNRDDALRDDISKAYDEIMANGVGGEKAEENAEAPKKDNVDLDAELFKSKVRTFKEKKTQEALVDVIKMLPGRRFLLPSVSNMKEPFENVNGEIKMKQGAVINPALLTSKDKKVFLPIFTDEQEMTQKSPSGIIMKFSFEQCVNIVYDEKNPVWAVAINPFTQNMIIGEDLLKMVFKKKEKED